MRHIVVSIYVFCLSVALASSTLTLPNLGLPKILTGNEQSSPVNPIGGLLSGALNKKSDPLCDRNQRNCRYGAYCTKNAVCESGSCINYKCGPVCKPSCKNGGECTPQNTCICPSPYFGPTCGEVMDDQYYNPSGRVVLTLPAGASCVLINKDILYASTQLPGTVVKTTVSVDRLSSPYSSITVAKDLCNSQGNFAIDSQGCVYISDSENHMVRRYTSTSSGAYAVIAGNGTAGAALNQVYYPLGVALDGQEKNIFVVDSFNQRILKFPANPAKPGKGTVVAGGSQGNGTNQLNGPYGLHYDAKNNYLYIANINSHTIVKWRPGEPTGKIIIGTGSCSDALNALCAPTAVTMDKHGNLFVTDYLNQRIMAYPWGTYENSGSIGIPIIYPPFDPVSITFDPWMRAYVAEYGCPDIWKFEKNS